MTADTRSSDDCMTEQNNSTTPITRMKRRRGQRLPPEQRKEIQQHFLDLFRVNANITLACLKIGVDRSQVYRWQEHDETFALEFKQAELAANDMLLAAAWERGVNGYEKPVVSMGKQVFVKEKVDDKEVEKPLMERVYSDSLLALLMKARMAEFRDKQSIEHSGPGGKPIQTQQVEVYKVRIPDNGRSGAN